MQLVIDIPQELPDALHCTASEFSQQAKMAMAAKLYEMGRVSSGMAAQMAGVDRAWFLVNLSHYGVAVHDLAFDELESDVKNA